MIAINTKILQADSAGLECAAKLLKGGEVVAFPTETVYGLGANALDARAIDKIFAAKGRPADNPLIIHIADKADFYKYARSVSDKAKALIDNFCPGPLTLVLPKAEGIADNVTAGLDSVAVRMPELPVARELIALSGLPIAAPSANLSGSPSPTCAADVMEDMQDKIAAIVEYANSGVGIESTVVDCTGDTPRLLRPGKITLDMLRYVVGEVELDSSVLSSMQVTAPRSPGMKYKHYAPKTPMYILEDMSIAQAREFLQAQINQHNQDIALLISRDLLDVLDTKGAQVRCWGSMDEVDKLARILYSALRQFDRSGVRFIYAQGVSVNGLGLAVMNRMRKSAAFNIIRSGIVAK